VLVVDDERNIAGLISKALTHQGFDAPIAASGSDALERAAELRPQLIVLDVMLPDIDGFEVARRIEDGGMSIPIIFLTAKDATEDKIRGLTLGGDDYMTKPFSVEELIARVRTILRRTAGAPRGEKLRFHDLELDEESRQVARAGRPIDLTNTEFRLLRFLVSNPRRVLTRAQILDQVWRYDFGGDARVLETYISYLRKKVDAQEPPLIHTIRGIGYVLREPRSQ